MLHPVFFGNLDFDVYGQTLMITSEKFVFSFYFEQKFIYKIIQVALK